MGNKANIWLEFPMFWRHGIQECIERKHEKTAVSIGDQSPELSVMNLILPLDRTARDTMLVAEMSLKQVFLK